MDRSITSIALKWRLVWFAAFRHSTLCFLHSGNLRFIPVESSLFPLTKLSEVWCDSVWSSLRGSCWGAARGSAGPLCTGQLWRKDTNGHKNKVHFLFSRTRNHPRSYFESPANNNQLTLTSCLLPYSEAGHVGVASTPVIRQTPALPAGDGSHPSPL